MRSRIHHALVRVRSLLRAAGRLAPLLTASVAACTAGPDPHATYPLVLALMGFSSPSIPGGTLSFDGAAWSPPTPFTPVTDAQVFGGITVLNDGRALAVLSSEPHRTTFATTVGSGSTWSSLGETDVGDVLALLSAPAPTPTGAVVLTQSQLGAVHVATFDAATSMWSAGEDTGLSVPTFHSPPVVVPLANGEDLFAMTLGPDRSFQLLWTRRTHGVWSAPSPVPGLVAVNILPTQALTRFAAVRRPRTDQVVVVATTDSDPSGVQTNVVSATTLTGDTWSTPVALMTDIDTSGSAVALAPLRDGRVALGLLDSSHELVVGMFDGTQWGPLRTVHGLPPVTESQVALALAAGHDASAVLEVAFPQGAEGMTTSHIRLLDESAWTWSAPVMVAPDGVGALVGLATAPVP